MTWAIGIDVGGTKIAAGLIDVEHGTVTNRRLVPTPATAEEVLTASVELALSAAAGAPIACVGIGVPEIVGPNGEIQSSSNWNWAADEVKARLGLLAPTWIEADVRAAALAEAQFGAGRGLNCFIYLSVGTNISAAIVHQGKPWVGRMGAAGIVGSPPVEEVSGGRALAASAGAAAAREVITAPEHKDLVATAAKQLGQEVARIVNLIDPETVVVGGGLGLNNVYRDLWVSAMRQSIWFPATALVPVQPAALGADAGVLGAALAAAERIGTR